MITRHVVLLTYGEPPTPAYFSQLKYSWRILLGLTRTVADIPAPLLPVIALSRARNRNLLWTRERYGSPLEPITRAQAEGLRAALTAAKPDVEWRVEVAYEFRDPLLARVLDRLPASDPVDVVPMYATDSAFTHQLSRAAAAAWLRRSGAASRPAPMRVLAAMEEERLAELCARHVLGALGARGVSAGEDWALVLAAHGTLLEPPRPIDTGREATERLCAAIARRLRGRFGMIVNGWLNHTYGGRWTEPPIDAALQQVVDAGYRRAVYFPYGFLADNAESELEGRLALRAQPGLDAVHLPCVNASPDFIAGCAGFIAAAAGSREAAEAQARAVPVSAAASAARGA